MNEKLILVSKISNYRPVQIFDVLSNPKLHKKIDGSRTIIAYLGSENSLKLNSFNPWILELTVFMSVKIDSLNALSKFIPDIVRSDDKIKSDNIKIKTEIKYLFTSFISNFEPENSNLFINTFSGFTCEANSFIENLNSE